MRSETNLEHDDIAVYSLHLFTGKQFALFYSDVSGILFHCCSFTQTSNEKLNHEFDDFNFNSFKENAQFRTSFILFLTPLLVRKMK